MIIYYACNIDKINDEISNIKSQISDRRTDVSGLISNWLVPVCYEEEFAIDLEDISVETKLEKSEIIKAHTEANYLVYFIGFLPGFLYLGGLDKRIHIKRRTEPRLAIKKGAVGIGGMQTGIYPKSSPGGWNIIGNSPIELFNPKLNPPCFAKAGDIVSFRAIEMKEYQFIKNLVDQERFNYESLKTA